MPSNEITMLSRLEGWEEEIAEVCGHSKPFNDGEHLQRMGGGLSQGEEEVVGPPAQWGCWEIKYKESNVVPSAQ